MAEEALPIVRGYQYSLRMAVTGGDNPVFPEGAKLRAQVREYAGAPRLLAELTFDNGGLRRVSNDSIDMVMSEAATRAIGNSSAVVEFSRTDVTPFAYLYIMLRIPVMKDQISAPVVVTVKPALAVALSTPPAFYGGLAGVLQGAGSAFASLSSLAGALLSGSALGSGSGTAALRSIVNAVMAGGAAGAGSAIGALSAQAIAGLSGMAAGVGSGVGALTAQAISGLSGAAAGAGSGVAVLRSIMNAALAGAAAGSGAGAGNLSSGGLPQFAYQAETTNYRSAATTTPTDRRVKSYDNAFKRLKDEGLNSALLGLWTAGANSVDSRRNLITPGTYDLVEVGAPVFTPNDGWIAATVTADALDTQIPISVLTPTSVSMGFTSVNSPSNSDNSDMGVVDGTGGAVLRAKSASASSARCRLFSTDYDVSNNALAEATGFHAISRYSSSGIRFNHNGIDATAETTAALVATTTASKTLHLLKANGAGTGGGRKFRSAFVAKRALTEIELRKLHAIILDLETALSVGEPTIFEAGYAPATASADVIVYGATSMGITAAYSAKRAGKSVILVGGWRDTNLGGMSGNGLGFTDFDNVSALWGLSAYMINRIKTIRGLTNGSSTIFESRHFEMVAREMLDPTRAGGLDIPIYWSTGVISATKSGARLATITTADGRTFTGGQFIDCSYETDLAPFAGVSFLVGREAAGTGFEANNGFRGIDLGVNAGAIRNPNDNTPLSVDPYIVPGDPASGLINLVSRRPATAVGGADSLNQAYNFRLTWTNVVARRIPFDTAPPPNYSKANYEVLLRQFALVPSMTFAHVFKADTLAPSIARDVNNQTNGFSTDSIVGAAEYIAATTYAGREAAWKNIENYILGLIYCLLYENDSRIPSAVRTTLATYGWDAYHYVGGGKAGDRLFFPRALYVRELRRLRSDMIWNGNDIAATDGTVPRSTKTISIASYAMDSHNTGRWEDTSVTPARVVNEGGLLLTAAGGTDKISPLPIDIFVPKKAECENCSFIFGASSTHIAFGSIRMELTAMETAQSMALAAVQAITTSQALQDLDYPTLRTAILNSATLTGETAPSLPQVN